MFILVYRRLEVASLELETTIVFKRHCSLSVITGIYRYYNIMCCRIATACAYFFLKMYKILQDVIHSAHIKNNIPNNTSKQ